MAHFIPGPHHVKHPMNRADIMMQPGGFRAVTGGPSIFGNGYYCNYGYGNYGYGNYRYADADDGKISFGQKVGSFFKGIGNAIKGAVKSLFTPKGFLKAVACVGACFIPGVGPFIAAGLAGVGVIKGAGAVIKGAQQASVATTDAEAMAAWENIGGGTFTVAASACALKGAAGAIRANTANVTQGALVTKGAATSKLGTHWQAAKATYRNSNMGQFTSAYGQAAKSIYRQSGGGLKGASAVVKGTYQGIKQNVHLNPNGVIARTKSGITNTYNNIKTNGITNTVKGAYGNLRTKVSNVNLKNIKTSASGTWQKVQTGAGKAWGTASKYGKAAYQNVKANPYTLAGSTTLLDPEEANAEFGTYSGYYV